MANKFKALVEQAAKLENQTETKSGGDFAFTVPVAGKTVGRLVEYVELGKQPRKAYKGTAKNPADEVRIVFELLSPKNIHEIENEGVKHKFADRISIVTNKILSDKAKFKKLFDKLRYGRDDVTHMAQMLGEAFIVTVTHSEFEKDGVKKTYANITNEAGEYLVESPFMTDPITDEVKLVPVPEALSDLKLFLWEIPTKETWESLYIDGTKTIKDSTGTEKEVSKNWLQAKILSATNITGSALEQFIQTHGLGLEELDTSAEPEQAPEEEIVKEEPKKSSAATGVVKDSKKDTTTTTQAKSATVRNIATTVTKSPSKAKTEAPVDPLVALGLA